MELLAALMVTVLILVIMTYRFVVGRHDGSIRPCAVSKAHLTCDPGSRLHGYNCVVAVVRFTGLIDARDLREQFLRCVIAGDPAFCRRMYFVRGSMVWGRMGPDWSPKDNISTVTDPIDATSMRRHVSDFLSAHVDLTRPCWEVEILSSVINEDGTGPVTVLLFKYHHALADGFTMIRQMISRIRPVDPSVKIGTLFPTARSPESKEHSPSVLTKICSISASLRSILMRKPDPPGVFRSTSLRKGGDTIIVALSSSLTLSRVKNMARLASLQPGLGQISVNDVLTAVVSGALRRHCLSEESGDSSVSDITTVVWVSLRKSFGLDNPSMPIPAWDNSSLGFAYCQLPLSVDSAKVRLGLCHSRLNTLKSSADAVVVNAALRVIGSLPVAVGEVISAVSADLASMSMSNLPGPSAPVHWPVARESTDVGSAGIVKEVYFVTSPPFHFGPLVSVISYCGQFYFSISARDDVLTQSELDSIIGVHLEQAATELERSLS